MTSADISGTAATAKSSARASPATKPLDIFWLTDESLSESDHLPAPGLITREIMEDLEAALE